MIKFAEKLGLSKKPRRLLVGGLRAEKILIATPLLKWYLNHGLIVSRIHTTVEFGKQACFKEFTQKVTDARRSSSSQINSETMKLIG